MSRLKRCIYLAVRFQDSDVESFRSKFDPLYTKCPAHITVVFPFDSDLPSEAIAVQMESLSMDQPSFCIKVGPPRYQNGYLTMPSISRHTWISHSHEALTRAIGGAVVPGFIPHFTIGREMNDSVLSGSVLGGKIISVCASQMVLEEIQSDDTSKKLHQFALK